MERPLDDAAMLHFIRDSLFRTDSPLHHEFSISLKKFITVRIASRESEWFPCISRDLHSLSQQLADTQAKVIALEQRIDALQTTAASATAATDHRVDTLQSSAENVTQAAVSELRPVVKKVPTRTGPCCTSSTITRHSQGLAPHKGLHGFHGFHKK